VHKLYLKLQRMQSLMQQNESLTYQELFNGIVPKVVSEYYSMMKEEVAKKLGSADSSGNEIMDCIWGLYKNFAPSIEKAGIDFDALRRNDETGKLTELVLKTAKRYAFESGRTQEIPDAASELISSIDFSKFSDPRVEQLVWQDIINRLSFIKKLEIHNSDYLTASILSEIVQKFTDLEELVLVNLDRVTLDGIKTLLRSWQGKKPVEEKTCGKKLVLEDCVNLGREVWQELLKEDVELYIRIDGYDFSLNKNPEELLIELIVRNKFSRELLEYLRENCHVDFNKSYPQLGSEGATLLHVASGSGQKDLVSYLLEHKLDVNKQEKHDYTALHSSVFKGKLEVMQLLLDSFNDSEELKKCLGLKTKKGETALDIAVNRSAAISGAGDIVKLLRAYQAPLGIVSKETLDQAMEKIAKEDQEQEIAELKKAELLKEKERVNKEKLEQEKELEKKTQSLSFQPNQSKAVSKPVYASEEKDNFEDSVNSYNQDALISNAMQVTEENLKPYNKHGIIDLDLMNKIIKTTMEQLNIDYLNHMECLSVLEAIKKVLAKNQQFMPLNIIEMENYVDENFRIIKYQFEC
jgi:ankyrin repeat protein